jgi:two-component system cell cycle response regulator DivK
VDGELILVVEDNEKSRKLVRDVLRFHGFATIDAATAAEGLALARERYPRLILLDIQLPDLDGTAVLARLRAEPATAAIPVVAFTAFAMQGDRERLLAAGFDGYLAKPVNIKALPEQVRRFCTVGVQARRAG